MAVRQTGIAAAVAILSCAWAAAATSAASCGLAKVEIEPPDAPEQAVICEAAAVAEASLAHCGVMPKRAYRIRVQSGLTNASGCLIFGNFRPRLGIASIVPIGECAGIVAALPPDDPISALAQIPTRVLYRSLAAHELAHAIVLQNLTATPSLPVYEYISGVVQIASLPDDVRQRYLSSFDHTGEYTTEMFNDLTLAMDPARFGVAAYFHFHKAWNGCPFLKRLLTEDAVLPGLR